MATQTSAKTYHANNAKILLGTLVLGEAVGITVQEDTGLDAVHVVGDIRAQEHNHNRLSVSVNIQYIKFKKSSLGKMGLGGASIVNLPPVDVHAYDKSDGTMQFKVKDCTMGGRSLGINANQRYSTDIRMQGIFIVPTDGQGQVVADTNGVGATEASAVGAPGTTDPTAPVIT